MPKFRLSLAADKDIFEIGEYIAHDSLEAAGRTVDEFYRIFDLLARSPMIGRERPEFGLGLRSFPLGQYVIVYNLVDNGILIVRVLSGYRDLETFF